MNEMSKPSPTEVGAGTQAHARRTGLLITLGLFLLALLPRITDLGAFVTADESKWVYRSAQFGRALLKLQWAETAVTLKPAVTTMWTGLLGLWAYVVLHGGGDFLQALSTSPSWKEFLMRSTAFSVSIPAVRYSSWPVEMGSVSASKMRSRHRIGVYPHEV